MHLYRLLTSVELTHAHVHAQMQPSVCSRIQRAHYTTLLP